MDVIKGFYEGQITDMLFNIHFEGSLCLVQKFSCVCFSGHLIFSKSGVLIS